MDWFSNLFEDILPTNNNIFSTLASLLLFPSQALPTLPSQITPPAIVDKNSQSEIEKLKQYAPYYHQAGQKYGVDPYFLMGIGGAESGFNPNAKNPSGAAGMHQFMPGTAKAYGLQNPYDPVASIDAAAKYVRNLMNMFGNYDKAAWGYNAGEGRVKQGIMPKETKHYIEKVKKRRALYKNYVQNEEDDDGDESPTEFA